MKEQYDLLIVGAGPAGMAAAIEATMHGLVAAVIDETSAPGGQIFRAIESNMVGNRRLLDLLGADYEAGGKLVAEFRQSGATYLPDTSLWRIDPDGWAAYSSDGASKMLKACHVLVATGAYERPVPIPGWTLPGVMTAGAAQILLKSGGYLPAGPTVLAGNGPLLLLVACQLLAAGCALEAVLETTGSTDYFRALRHLPRALGAPEYLAKGLAMRRTIRGAGVPMFSGVRGLSVVGKTVAEAVRFRVGGQEKEIAAKTILLHQGVIPNTQITRALECKHRWAEESRYWQPIVDAWGATSLATVHAAGDCAGIVGARASEAAGRLAALDIACRLDKFGHEERDRLATPWRRSLRHHLLARPLLDCLFRPTEDILLPENATTVCRCEDVCAGEIRAAAALGCAGPNQLKAFTRAGMGPCQGRLCGLPVAEIIAAESGKPVQDVGYYRIRPPIKPVTLEEIAAMDGLAAE